MNIRTLLIMCTVAASLSACGGGGGDLIEKSATTPVISSSQALAPGTYKLTFTAISTAQLVAPISGIYVAVKFPDGISVNTVTGGSGEITGSSFTSGSAVQWSPYGNYSASTRTAYFNMATAQSSYRGGQYLNLLFNVAPGATVTPNGIFTLNAYYKVVGTIGVGTSGYSSVVMTDSVKTTLGVVR